MEKTIAGRIYKLFKTQDAGLAMIKSFDLLKECDLEKVCSCYKQLADGEVALAEVFSAEELGTEQKASIKKKISDLFDKEVIVIFEQDSEILGGLVIKVGDNLIDESIRSKIQDIEI